MNISGAAVVVVGASSGIGEAAALAFAHRGARVVVAARRTDRLDALVDRIEQEAVGRSPRPATRPGRISWRRSAWSRRRRSARPTSW